MSNPIDGLQFPLDPHSKKSSSSQTGKNIIAEALSSVDPQRSKQVLQEKKLA